MNGENDRREQEEEEEEGMHVGGGGHCFEPKNAHKSLRFLSHLLSQRSQKSEMSAVTEK